LENTRVSHAPLTEKGKMIRVRQKADKDPMGPGERSRIQRILSGRWRWEYMGPATTRVTEADINIRFEPSRTAMRQYKYALRCYLHVSGALQGHIS
jgi:hypothetical protein